MKNPKKIIVTSAAAVCLIAYLTNTHTHHSVTNANNHTGEQLVDLFSRTQSPAPDKLRQLQDEMDVVCFDTPFSLGLGEKVDIALDRLYVKGNGAGKCFQQFEPLSSLDDLASRRYELASKYGKSVSLVGFLQGAPKTKASMRTISDTVLVKTEMADGCIKDAAALGLEFLHRSPSHPSYYVFRAKDGNPLSALRATDELVNSKNVELAQMNVGKEIKKHNFINDPLFPLQWHLKNTGQENGTPGEDINVTPAWELAQGTGIVIGVNDDGMQHNHPDLVANLSDFHLDMSRSTLVFNANGSLNTTTSVIVQDTSPAEEDTDDNHGTPVAGIAAARGNNLVGVTGAAPFALLSSIRFLNIANDNIADVNETALAFTYRALDTHIKNNSWGETTVARFDNIFGIEADALMQSGTTGRGGRGTIHTFSVGNEREEFNQAIKSGYLNSPFVIPVAATSNRGGHANYSDFGPMVVVAAPSSTSSASGTVTTDRTGTLGDNTLNVPGELLNNDYTKFFGGTSSSCPLVSAVIALMLQANPTLSYRDVKEILLRTSVRPDLDGRGWATRDGLRPDMPAIKHHNSYGGGRIDAHAAVLMARDWSNLPALAPEVTKNIVLAAPATMDIQSRVLPSFVVQSIDTNTDPLLRVEHVFVEFPNNGLTIGNIPDLSLTLIAPDGTESEMHLTDPQLANIFTGGPVPAGFQFTSVRHWGSLSRGIWRLRIADGNANFVDGLPVPQTIRLSSARLRLSGTPISQVQSRIIAVTGPAGLDYGTQDVGNDHVRVFTITNTGGIPMNVSSVSFSGDAVFRGGFSGIVPAGASRNFDVTFSPTMNRVFTARMFVDSNANQGLSTVEIKGTGRQVTSPTISSVENQTFRAGASISIPIASQFAVSFRASGLPRGMMIDPVSGIISGNATAPGTYKVVVTAINPWGNSVIRFDMVINPVATVLQGSYTMQVSRSGEINTDFGGTLRMNVLANGTFSGSLALGLNQLPIRGVLAGQTTGNPRVNQVVSGRNTPNYLLDLELRPDQTVTGSISFVGSFSSARAIVTGWKNSFAVASNYPNVGVFNHRLSLNTAAAQGLVSVPQGHSFYSQSIDRRGVSRVLGTTADGQRFSFTGDISATGNYTVWNMIYRGRGVIADSGIISNRVATGSGYWIKTLHDLPSATLYPLGFGLLLDFALVSSGGYYVAPTDTQAYLNKVPGVNNAAIRFIQGGVAGSVMNPNITFSLGASGLITLPNRGSTQNPANISLRIDKRNGQVSGQMTLVDPNPIIPVEPYRRTVKFTGIIEPSTNRAYGYFILNQLSPTSGLPIPLSRTNLLSGAWTIE